MTINLLIVAYTIQVEQLTLSNVITAVAKGQLALAYPIVAIKQYAVQTNVSNWLNMSPLYPSTHNMKY